MKQKSFSVRWAYLAMGVAALLCAGVIYAWSILKTPLAEEFLWSGSQLAVNFTLTICTFCLGTFAGGLLSKRLGPRLCLLLSAALGGIGFILASRLSGQSIMQLYITYGVIAGFGIGIAYNIIISTVSAWFPDKKGFCSGALLMGFGASALVVGQLAARLIDGPGWRTAYLAVGIALIVVLTLTALFLRRPDAGTVLPDEKKNSSGNQDDTAQIDYTTAQMLRRSSFWKAFLWIVFFSAVGNTVISFARDLSISVGAGASLATTLVGVLSVCNGLGRIATGALFDRIGRKATMLFANCLTIAAAGITLIAVLLSSVPLCVLGLCLVGFSYGAGPTLVSAVTSAFYGTKNFPMNFSVMNFNLMFASFMATISSRLLEATGSYTVPFQFLLTLATISLILNICIKRP